MVSKMILDGEKGHKVEYNDPDCIINVDIIRVSRFQHGCTLPESQLGFNFNFLN